MTSADPTLDVRGLPAPEPLERCLDALADLRPGQRLQLLIDREPHPLYAILARGGFRHACAFDDPHYRVTIWRD
ncbi:hypothetical protein CDEF62S_01269 [Castellaniella defragrans]